MLKCANVVAGKTMQSKEEAEHENLQEHKIACARGMVGHKSLALQQKVQKEIQKKN